MRGAGRPIAAATPWGPVTTRLIASAALIPAILLGIDGWLDLASAVPALASLLANVLPLDATSASLPVVLTGALASFLLAIALLRRKAIAWYLAIPVLVCGALQQGLVHSHPVGAVMAVICIAILLVDRGRYCAQAPTGAERTVAVVVAIGIAGLVLMALARTAGVLTGATAAAGAAPVRVLIAGVEWSAFGDPSSALGFDPDGLTGWLIALARVPFVVALLIVLRPRGEDTAGSEVRGPAARATALRYGHGGLVPFQVAPDKQLFTDQRYEAVLAYGRSGRVACIVGDPIGPPDQAWQLFDTFLETAAQRDWIPAVYQASEEGRLRLERAGFSCYAIGREAFLDLAGFDLTGPRRANVRHTVTRARKGGVRVEWFPDGMPHGEVERHRAAFESIDRAWRRGAGPSLGFTIGRFALATLEDRPVSVAFGADREPVAFTTYLPTGVDGGWVLDLMRRLPRGVPGAMEWCVAEAATRLGAAGESRLSLSLAPLAGIGAPGAPLPERILARASRSVRPVYDVRGLEFFKHKFDVAWAPRFLAVRHAADVPSVGLALLALHLRRG